MPLDPGFRRDDETRSRSVERSYTTTSWAEYPSGAAEHRSQFGIERAALSELDLQAARRGKSCEFGERPNWREAQGTRVSGQASGAAFLLDTFLWRSKEKYLAVRAKPAVRCPTDGKTRFPPCWASRCSVQPTDWIPACAGMTGRDRARYPKNGHKECAPTVWPRGMIARAGTASATPYILILFHHSKFQWRSPIVYMALVAEKR